MTGCPIKLQRQEGAGLLMDSQAVGELNQWVLSSLLHFECTVTDGI